MLIHEMARQLQITPRAIRFYEEKGLIAPSKGETSGYRRFTQEDAWRLQTVVALREVGMPIEQIQQLLSQVTNTSHSILPYLELQRAYMYDRWVELKNAIQTTESMIQQVKQHQFVEPESLYQLAEGSKRLRQTRKEWVDRWDFNQFAGRYDDWVADQTNITHHGYDKVLACVVQYTSPKPYEIGLDAGTGTGNLAKKFEGQCHKLFAFDQSLEMLAHCKAKNPEIETKLGNFLAIPFLDHSFDFCVTSYAMHHLTDEQKALAIMEFDRVLKPMGRLVIADFMFADDDHRKRHLLELRENGQEDLIQEIEDEYYANCAFLVGKLEELGFYASAIQLNTYIHLISAKKA